MKIILFMLMCAMLNACASADTISIIPPTEHEHRVKSITLEFHGLSQEKNKKFLEKSKEILEDYNVKVLELPANTNLESANNLANAKEEKPQALLYISFPPENTSSSEELSIYTQAKLIDLDSNFILWQAQINAQGNEYITYNQLIELTIKDIAKDLNKHKFLTRKFKRPEEKPTEFLFESYHFFQ